MIPLSDNNPTHRFPLVTILIIAVNAAVFFLWQTRIGLEQSVALAGFVPATLAGGPGLTPLQDLFTCMFMHGGFLHLLGNMWFLWIFGDNVESECGRFRFSVYYLACGVGATLAHVWADPRSTVPLVGASGAISGVLGGYLIQHPGAPIRTLIPMGLFSRIVEIPAFAFLFIWIGMQIFSQAITGSGEGRGGVAYLAHIAGFIAGSILIFLFRRRNGSPS